MNGCARSMTEQRQLNPMPGTGRERCGEWKHKEAKQETGESCWTECRVGTKSRLSYPCEEIGSGGCSGEQPAGRCRR